MSRDTFASRVLDRQCLSVRMSGKMIYEPKYVTLARESSSNAGEMLVAEKLWHGWNMTTATT